MEAQSNDGTHIGERRDAVKTPKLGVQCLHLSGHLSKKWWALAFGYFIQGS